SGMSRLHGTTRIPTLPPNSSAATGRPGAGTQAPESARISRRWLPSSSGTRTCHLPVIERVIGTGSHAVKSPMISTVRAFSSVTLIVRRPSSATPLTDVPCGASDVTAATSGTPDGPSATRNPMEVYAAPSVPRVGSGGCAPAYPTTETGPASRTVATAIAHARRPFKSCAERAPASPPIVTLASPDDSTPNGASWACATASLYRTEPPDAGIQPASHRARRGRAAQHQRRFRVPGRGFAVIRSRTGVCPYRGDVSRIPRQRGGAVQFTVTGRAPRLETGKIDGPDAGKPTGRAPERRNEIGERRQCVSINFY